MNFKSTLKVFILLSFFSLSSIDASFAWTTPTHSSPSTGSTTYGGVTIDWNAISSSAAYQYQYDTLASFNSPVKVQGTLTYINTSSGNTDTQFTIGNTFYYGKTYYWRVRAYVSGDTSAWSSAWTFITPIYGPTLLTPTIGTANVKVGVTLDWSSHYYVAAYDWQLDTVSSFTSTVKRQGSNVYINTNSSNTDTEVTLGDLFYGKTYYWRVRSRNAVDTSAWTTVWTFTTTSPGPALLSPSSGTANVKVGVTLNWDSHYYVVGYDWQADTVATFNSSVKRQGSNVYINTNSSNTDTEVTLGDLFYGQTYYWRVRSRNAVDTSAWTTAWTFTTTSAGPALLSPSTGTANVKVGVTLNWDSHYYVAAYDWQLDTVSSFTSTAKRQGSNVYINTNSSNTDTEVTLGDLFYGKTYYWRVRSRNAVDTSAWTSVWTFTTTSAGPALLSPSSGTANVKVGVTLNWDSHYYVVGYDWQADTVATFNSSVKRQGSNVYINTNSSNTDTEVTLGDLFYGQTYYWRVRSRNAVDTSAWTTAWTFTTTSAGPALLSPSSGTANVKAGVTLNWDSHYYVVGYDWQVDTVATFNSTIKRQGSNVYINTNSSNTDTEVTLGDLFYGKTYYWRVRSRNNIDTSAWTTAWTFTVTLYGPNLLTPTNGQINVSTAGTTLDWDSHYYVVKYQVEADTNNQFNSTLLVHADKAYVNTSNSNSDTQHSLTSLLSNTIYYWRVRSMNNVDTSEWTSVWAFNTGAAPAIAPTLISPVNNANSIAVAGTTLQWSSVTSATSYEYQFDDNSSFTSPATGTTASLTVSTGNLLANSTYYWKARAVNASGNSPWSVIWAFNTLVTTGISDIGEMTDILVYPNPATDVLYIDGTQNSEIEILNIEGQILRLLIINNNHTILDISDLAEGLYFVKVKNETGTLVKKFVKE